VGAELVAAKLVWSGHVMRNVGKQESMRLHPCRTRTSPLYSSVEESCDDVQGSRDDREESSDDVEKSSHTVKKS
jgi:hypothetical protein